MPHGDFLLLDSAPQLAVNVLAPGTVYRLGVIPENLPDGMEQAVHRQDKQVCWPDQRRCKGNPAQNRQLGADNFPAAGDHQPADPGTQQAPHQPHHVPLPDNRQALWARLYRTAAQKTAEKGRNHRKHPLPRIASHLRHAGDPTGSRRQNHLQHPGSLQCRLHLGHLHPRNQRDAERSRPANGCLHSPGSLNAAQKSTEISREYRANQPGTPWNFSRMGLVWVKSNLQKFNLLKK